MTDRISFSYDHNESQIEALSLGHQWQNYENQQRLLGDSWVRYFEEARQSVGVLVGLSAAFMAWLTAAFVPQFQMPGLLHLVSFGAAVGFAAWLIAWRVSKQSATAYTTAFLKSSLAREIERAKTVAVQIGVEGFEARTATDIVILTWHRYILAIQQEKHLVLVFEGSVFALPHEALPLAPKALTDKINAWAETMVNGYSGTNLSKKLKTITARKAP
jgi:hypothetical protein